VPLEWQEPLKLECEAFVDSIRTGRPPVSNAWMGVKVIRVLEMAQRSLFNSGGWEGVRA
jgi:predicted dehydrogenase